MYPWGNEITPDHANYTETGLGTTSPVGCFPKGASPYGVQDLSGNVWEWTRSLYEKYPYDPGDRRENLNAPNDVARVLRGGSWDDDRRGVRAAIRVRNGPLNWYVDIGFRVVLSLAKVGGGGAAA